VWQTRGLFGTVVDVNHSSSAPLVAGCCTINYMVDRRSGKPFQPARVHIFQSKQMPGGSSYLTERAIHRKSIS